MKKQLSFLFIVLASSCLLDAVSGEKNSSQSSVINGTDWMDTEGRRISAHEGELARFGDYFYWYGSSYKNNPKGKFRMTAGPVWNGVQVYRSKDLKNWEYRGVCLPRPESGFGKMESSHPPQKILRLVRSRFKSKLSSYIHTHQYGFFHSI